MRGSTECEMVEEELGAQAVLVEADELLEGGREGATVVLEEQSQVDARTELLRRRAAREELRQRDAGSRWTTLAHQTSPVTLSLCTMRWIGCPKSRRANDCSCCSSWNTMRRD